MSAMFWKEIRQWWKLSAAGFLLLSAALFLQTRQHLRFDAGVPIQIKHLVSSELQMIMAIGSGAFGFILGFAQMFSEAQRDQWAFLVHRPLSPGRIFWNKAAAGLALHLAAGSPFFIYAIWAAVPGHVPAPFESAMVWPGIVDLLAGVSSYFAGTLVALRPVRWHGTRTLPLVSIPVILVGTYTCNSAFDAMCLVTICGCVMALAAWGSFETCGEFEPQRIVSKAAMVLISSAGCLLVLGALVAGPIGVLVLRPVSGPTEHYRMADDGRIYKVKGDSGRILEIRDLEGRPYMPPSGRADSLNEFYQHLISGATLAWEYFANRPSPLGFRESGAYFQPLNAESAIWSFRMSDGRVHGYDTRTFHHLGSIGPAGFATSGVQTTREDRFDGPSANAGYSAVLFMGNLISSNRLYAVSCAERSVKKLFEGPAEEGLLFASPLGGRNPGWIAALTDKAIYLKETDGPGLVRCTTGRPSPSYPNLSVYLSPLNGHIFLWSTPGYAFQKGRNANLPMIVTELSATGEPIARRELPPIKVVSDSGGIWESVTTMIVPPVLLAAVYTVENLRGARVNTIPTSWPVLGAVVGLVGVLFGATLVQCRRHSLAKLSTIAWAFVVLMGGLSGFIAFLGINEWSVFEQCKACKRKRLVSREHCEHCGAEFDPAPKDGTEIFSHS